MIWVYLGAPRWWHRCTTHATKNTTATGHKVMRLKKDADHDVESAVKGTKVGAYSAAITPYVAGGALDAYAYSASTAMMIGAPHGNAW